jgi:hypothetical protein
VDLRLQLATKAFNAAAPAKIVAEKRGRRRVSAEKTA